MKKLMFSLIMLFASSMSHALLISASASVDQNNQFTIDYTFTATNVDIEAFDLFFDFDLFENLQLKSDAVVDGWEAFIFPRNEFFGVKEPATLSFESLGTALLSGESLLGFSFTIDFIGDVLPETFTQAFEVYDPFTFDPIETDQGGLSSLISVESTAVNAPTGIMLLSLSFIALMAMRTRKQKGQ
jgi:hypothetical protein